MIPARECDAAEPRRQQGVADAAERRPPEQGLMVRPLSKAMDYAMVMRNQQASVTIAALPGRRVVIRAA
jgi:hypothetical protein